ncbi:transposase [Gluconacetobacter diazotrophicus]|uniref:Transposase n=1 Tax=Gluconacetobacter diazotrophicus TaxID=33996 RepID=A0A7W4FF78_GLUDI|nr:RNA-guided endonuclease TnpB family protein [Gluconacetobacter diazotrophicus]MBB2156624.1 transposase [Gluconacetobacter diazotrophicus]
MIVRKANTYRLYPDTKQREALGQIAGACRMVYNLALEQRRDWWQRYKAITGKSISYNMQSGELTALKREVSWLRDAPSQVLQQALRDLDRAYQNFFSGRSGYPSPRRKGLHDSFRFPDPASLRVDRTGKSAGRLKLPKLGWVAFRGWYALPGAIRNVTISRRAGQWFASVQWEREVEEPGPPALPAVGIDLGVSVFAAMSNGKTIAPGNFGKKALRALRKAQRALDRKKKGSANRRKAVWRVQTLHARVANARKDFLHKISTTIAKNHGMVVVEALQVRSMSASAKGTAEEPGRNVRQKAGLNRSILDQGWRTFRSLLGYKLAERGGSLIEVPAAYTSQTCSVCGAVDPASRATQARFVCTNCGYTENADVNAAKNILRRADCSLKSVEGHRIQRPDEAESTRRAA